MDRGAFVYMLGTPQPHSGPLGRFLPPIAAGVGAAWLRKTVPQASWVVDPFGTSPRLALEAAQAGYRLLAAVNNPIARFLFEMHVNPPTEEALRLALADLGASTKAGERLEPHLRSLYHTHCAACSAEVEAQAFVWERGASAPAAKIYACPHCKDSGERPATSQDAERALRSAGGPLHRARALERVAPLDDPDRGLVEEALAMYLPRAVYVLFTLVNKLDSARAEQQRHLQALLLAAFDQGSVLWAHPATRARPKQLGVPPRFLERNLWLVLEEAVTAWPAALQAKAAGPRLELVNWPDLPGPEGGICLFEGRLRNLAAGVRAAGGPPVGRDQTTSSGSPEPPASVEAAYELGGLPFHFEAMLTAPPRPNQAFWTLSALWSGWLWGAEASAAIKSVLRRRRYDWDWHTEALHANLHHLAELLAPGVPALGLIGEVEPGFLSSIMAAADRAGFSLEGIALRSAEGQAQIEWRRSARPAAPAVEAATPLASAVRQAAEAYLRQRGEPSSYLEMHAAILADLAGGRLAAETGAAGERSLERLNGALSLALEAQGNFARFGGSSRSLEVGMWWLPATRRDAARRQTALADRVEVEAVHILQNKPSSTPTEVDAALCAAFPGLLTPQSELVRSCIESYAQSDSSGRVHLRPEDIPSVRRADMLGIVASLEATGKRLGFLCETHPAAGGPQQVQWVDPTGHSGYIFYVIASALIGELLLENFGEHEYKSRLRRVIVLPGSRAALVEYKLANDPRLAKAIDDGWRLAKYRHVRRLTEDPRLSGHNLESQLELDPLENRDPQMTLL